MGMLRQLTTKEVGPKIQALLMSPSTKVVKAAVSILASMLETLTEAFAVGEEQNVALDTLVDYVSGLIPNRT